MGYQSPEFDCQFVFVLDYNLARTISLVLVSSYSSGKKGIKEEKNMQKVPDQSQYH